MSSEATDAARVTAGKYMTFKLAHEEYGFEILMVREIIRVLDITRVPKTHPFMRGVINLRGKVIPVVDLRVKFGMGRTVATDQTVIIVVQCPSAGRGMTVGVLVDEVVEVLSIAESAVEPPPEFGASAIDPQFILGVGKADKRVIFLLDVSRVLAGDDAEAVPSPSASPPSSSPPHLGVGA